MKEAIVSPDTIVHIQDSSVPTPGPHEMLVKVMVAGTNPKDWKFPEAINKAHNSGDDVAGIVEAVGSEVDEFQKGDRVAGMHCFPEPHGAFAEYAILQEHMAFHLPAKVTFGEAATLPMTALTAACGLFWDLGLPSPWQKAPDTPTPLIIYGASTAVGAFAIKLASAAGIHPIVAVGSTNSSFVKGYLDSSKGDTLIDYKAHADPDALVKSIREAVACAGTSDDRAMHALDAISERGTFDAVVSKAIAGKPKDGRRPRLAVVLPGKDYGSADPTVEVTETYCGIGHQAGPDGRRFVSAVFRALYFGLQEGWLTGHPYEFVPDGLEGLQGALIASKDGMIKAKKLLLKIGS